MKTNIEYLRDILKELGQVAPTLAAEAEEFLDAYVSETGEGDGCERCKDLEEEIEELKKEKNDKNEEIASLENEVEQLKCEVNVDNIGLDVIKWELEKGNLQIQSQMEAFVEQLRRQYGILPSQSRSRSPQALRRVS